MAAVKKIMSHIRDIPDFPHEGILFKDVTPILGNPDILSMAIEQMITPWSERPVDKVIGIESRGFIFGTPIAQMTNAGFVPLRKPGKLPSETFSQTYELEYGQDALEMHVDAVKPRDEVLIVDDLLATGGTAEAACKLVEMAGGTVIGVCFLVELGFLNGRDKLDGYQVESVVVY
jgi:adenine phosphoribosyltransferase